LRDYLPYAIISALFIVSKMERLGYQMPHLKHLRKKERYILVLFFTVLNNPEFTQSNKLM
jgi:hypothetical protein